MSKKLTLLNSANIFSQNLVGNLKGFKNVCLGDIYNSRMSVSKLLVNFSFFLFWFNFSFYISIIN